MSTIQVTFILESAINKLATRREVTLHFVSSSIRTESKAAP